MWESESHSVPCLSGIPGVASPPRNLPAQSHATHRLLPRFQRQMTAESSESRAIRSSGINASAIWKPLLWKASFMRSCQFVKWLAIDCRSHRPSLRRYLLVQGLSEAVPLDLGRRIRRAGGDLTNSVPNSDTADTVSLSSLIASSICSALFAPSSDRRAVLCMAIQWLRNRHSL